tara:strand:+ start:190 stop:639 length:450 start_codon:yes stop_codon:yes gene_type:complete
MSAIKLSVIRSRLKTAIENISGGGLKESPLPFQAFGRTPNAIGHKSFSIGILSSNSTDDRQKANIGTLTQTDIQIQMSFRLKPLAQNEDVDNAMDLENAIIIAVCNRTDTNLYQNLHFKFVSCSRVLVDSGEYILSSINFESLHYLPLQ